MKHQRLHRQVLKQLDLQEVLKEQIAPKVVTETENVEIIKAFVRAGMGVTIILVVAAEMISGGGSQSGGSSGGGLGFFIWNSYVGGSYQQIVVGMISIGIAGFISSELLRRSGRFVTPWLHLR